MKLSIVIVNWNSATYAVDCISSIHSALEGVEYEVIVVDNASSDDSREVLERLSSPVRLIRSSENLGFAGANNLAFQQSVGQAILFLNPDTKILDNAIQTMLSVLGSSPDIGAVGCRLLNGDLTIQTSCIQPLPTVLNQLVDIEWLKRRWPRLRIWGIWPLYEATQKSSIAVEAISGACLLVKRDVFERVGLFSTDYFMYTEDLDLCHKISGAGYRVCYTGDASVVHYGGESTKKQEDGFKDVVMRQSIFRFLQKSRGNAYAALYRVAVSFSAVVRLGLLSLAFISPVAPLERNLVLNAFRKWRWILMWSLGLRQGSRQLAQSSSRLEAIVRS